MKKLTLITILSLVLTAYLSAQQSPFMIILNKGDNTHGVEADQNHAMLGEILQNDEVLTVVKGGYMALVNDETGLSIELKEAGEYKVNDLQKMIADQSNTVLSKYGKFLMSKINPEGNGNQNLNVTGAVERGSVDFVNVFLPKVTDVYGERLLIAWQQTDDVTDYTVTIKNTRDEVVAQQQVSGNKYMLSFDQAPFKEMKLLIINVASTENHDVKSKDYGINRISDELKKDIQGEYENLLGVADTENVIDKLLIASFFEENELLGDAISYYDQALALSPDADGFGKLYNNFLYRNNLK